MPGHRSGWEEGLEKWGEGEKTSALFVWGE